MIGAGRDAAYTARHVALRSVCGVHSTALTLNRLCRSGFETLIQASHAITLGDAQVCIAGGTEQMSQAPLQVLGTQVRWGTPLGTGLPLSDAVWDGWTDAYAGSPMGVTAEILAVQFGISRSDCDEFALRSQKLWTARAV